MATATAPMPTHPERWNDPCPHVTAAVHATLTDGSCGPEMELFLYGLNRDLQLAIALKVATVAIEAHLAGRKS